MNVFFFFFFDTLKRGISKVQLINHASHLHSAKIVEVNFKSVQTNKLVFRIDQTAIEIKSCCPALMFSK